MAKEPDEVRHHNAVMDSVSMGLDQGLHSRTPKLQLEAGTIGLFYTHPFGSYVERLVDHHVKVIEELFPILVGKLQVPQTQDVDDDIASVTGGIRRFIRSVLLGEDPPASLLIRASDPDNLPNIDPTTYCLIRPTATTVIATGEVAIFAHVAYRHKPPGDEDVLFAARTITPGRHYGREESVIRPIGLSS